MPEADPAQLPHLLALLDDESRIVRDSVLAELDAFGETLDVELARLSPPPTPRQMRILRTLLGEYRERATDFHAETPEGTILGSALFAPGDLVRHRRYGYRGVVVEVDRRCEADEEWYQRNRTQPEREQPWYHLLVDGSPAATYAAQTSLLPDETGEPVDHPLVPHFFDGFDGHRYRRNGLRWPGRR